MASSEPYRIVVLGCGVIGLTCALRIQERFPSANVAIVAEVLAEDPLSILYTSCWAGAHYLPVSDDPSQRQLEDETWNEMWPMVSPEHPHYNAEAPLMKTRHISIFDETPRKGLGIDLFRSLPGFRELDQLPEGAVQGCTFETFTIDTPNYLKWLSKRFVAAGGTLKRQRLTHIAEALGGEVEGLRKVDAIIEATGLGARTLGGVEDETMFPIRGQTVLIRAPWLKDSYGRSAKEEGSDPPVTYIIPRPSGDVILGGTRKYDDWEAEPRADISKGITERCLALCPELLPPDKRAAGRIEDLDVIMEGCGLRPARRDGIRLELELVGATPVIHANGFAGGGYQKSIGAANRVCELLREALHLPTSSGHM